MTTTEQRTEDVAEGPKRNGGGDGAASRARVEDSVATPATPASASAMARLVPTREQLTGLADRARNAQPYRGRPESIAEVVAYTRAGGFVPGDWPWWVEAPGLVYGWAVAVPAAVCLNTLQWVVTRPGRLVLVLFLLAALWLAW